MSFFNKYLNNFKKQNEDKTMKKILLVAFAIITMTFASCGNGKSAEAVENNNTVVYTVVIDSTVVVDSVATDTIVAE